MMLFYFTIFVKNNLYLHMLDHHLLNPTRGTVRNHLQAYTKKPLKIGNNFIQVLKILEKWVTVSESRNDLVQAQKRVPIKDAIIYFEYKKHLLSTTNTISDDLVDPKTQNKQYQTQYENYYETFIDVQNALTVIWKKHSSNFSFFLSDDAITIEFPGYQVIIRSQENSSIKLSTNFNTTLIDTNLSYTFLKAYAETSELLFDSSNKNSIEFNIDFNHLLIYKKQLKLLVSYVKTEELSDVDKDIRAKIKTFLMTAKKGQTISFDYNEIDLNGSIFKRTFNIIKLTKIRTVVKVIAKCDEIELSEFTKTFTKVSHQIEFHADEMQKLYLANK